MAESLFRKFIPFLAAAAVLMSWTSPSQAMRFSHVVHEREGLSECSRCHLPNATDIIPSRSICYDCHEEKSIEETVLGPKRTHTPLWVGKHGLESEMADAQCAECHTLSFCIDCHKGGELGPDLKRRTARIDTAPRTHTSRFRIVHPLKAIGESIEQCYACHSRQDCIDCHNDYRNRFPNRELVSHQKNETWVNMIEEKGAPEHNFSLDQCQDCHPGGALSEGEWSSRHAREARRSLSGCQTCHPEGAACMPCHSATTGLMVSPHPRNWKKIQGKFRRESPEVCDKCH